MNNEQLKYILIYLLAGAVCVFAWFGKIDSATFTGFVSATVMWGFNSSRIKQLTSENKELNNQITTLSNEKYKIITERNIKDQG